MLSPLRTKLRTVQTSSLRLKGAGFDSELPRISAGKAQLLMSLEKTITGVRFVRRKVERNAIPKQQNSLLSVTVFWDFYVQRL